MTAEKKKGLWFDILIIGGTFSVIIALLGGAIWLFVDQSGKEEEIEVPAEQNKESFPVTPKNLPKKQHAAPTPVKQEPVIISLPVDSDKLAALFYYTVNGQSMDGLKLVAANITQPVEISIPAGTLAIPSETSDLSSYIVRETVHFKLSPGQTANAFIPVVSMKVTSKLNPRGTDEFILQSGDPDSLVGRFIDRTAKRKMTWPIQQTGVWMIATNINPKNFHQVKISGASVWDPSGGQYSRMASYSDLMRVTAELVALGQYPWDFELFKDAKNKFRDLLKEVDFDQPGKNYSSILTNKTLLEYAIEPKVERVLLRYLKEHPKTHIRETALRNLVEVGLKGSADELYSRLIAENDYTIQFLLSLTLLRKTDVRAFPLLAMFEKDAHLEKYFSRQLAAAIKSRSGQNRKHNEKLIQYFERAIGWNNVSDNQKIVDQIHQLADKINDRPDPWLVDAIRQTKSTDNGKVKTAIRSLKKYRDNPRAYKALQQLALQHTDVNVRIEAVSTIALFTDFDLYHLFSTLLKSIHDERFGEFVISSLVRSKTPGYSDLLLTAIASKHPKVRKRAINALANDSVEAAIPRFLKLAISDPEWAVRNASMRALANANNTDAIPLFAQLLKSAKNREKWAGLNFLKRYKNNKDALGALERYKSDPVIGKTVIQHLKKYKQ